MATGQRSSPARIVSACHHLASLGFAAATDGNISVRSDARTVRITRSGLSLRSARASDILTVRYGRVATSRSPRPSSEMPLHEALYRSDLTIQAVVHVHPPYATALAAAGVRLTPNVLPEVVLELGDVPLVRYVMPSTPRLGEAVARYAATCGGALLANHGAVTWGRTLEHAVLRMEKLEHASMVEVLARPLGGVRQLRTEDITDLRNMHPLSTRRGS